MSEQSNSRIQPDGYDMDTVLSDEQWQELVSRGVLYVPGFLNKDEVAELRATTDDLYERYPFGFVGGRGTGDKRPVPREHEPAHESAQVMPIIGSGFHAPLFHKLITKGVIYDTMQRLLGPGFRFGSAHAHTVRPNIGRLQFHKDAYGLAGAVLLIDEFDHDNGGTSIVPGSHVNTPGPYFCMNDVRDSHPDEIQTVGKPGDLYLFLNDAWHGRSLNTSDTNKRKVMYLFQSRNHFPAPDWSLKFSPEAVKEAAENLPEQYHHLFDWWGAEEGAVSEKQNETTGLQRWSWRNGSGNNETIIRDIIFNAMNAGRFSRPDAKDAELPNNMTYPHAATRFRVAAYLSQVNIKVTARMYASGLLRALPGGAALLRLRRRGQAGN
jgi:hypothetical protein